MAMIEEGPYKMVGADVMFHFSFGLRSTLNKSVLNLRPKSVQDSFDKVLIHNKMCIKLLKFHVVSPFVLAEEEENFSGEDESNFYDSKNDEHKVEAEEILYDGYEVEINKFAQKKYISKSKDLPHPKTIILLLATQTAMRIKILVSKIHKPLKSAIVAAKTAIWRRIVK